MEKDNSRSYITFRSEVSGRSYRGEVRERHKIGCIEYISLYNYRNRRENIFICEDGMTYREENSLHIPVVISTSREETRETNKVRNWIIRIVALVCIAAMLMTSIPALIVHIPGKNLPYREFLTGTYSLSTLTAHINARMRYRYDMYEEWTPPEEAWRKRFGDCEEYASIVADYCTFHGERARIIAVPVKGEKNYHAITIIEEKGYYYAVDPLGTVEKRLVHRFPKGTTLKEAVMKYSDRAVPVFAIPRRQGERRIVEWIY